MAGKLGPHYSALVDYLRQSRSVDDVHGWAVARGVDITNGGVRYVLSVWADRGLVKANRVRGILRYGSTEYGRSSEMRDGKGALRHVTGAPTSATAKQVLDAAQAAESQPREPVQPSAALALPESRAIVRSGQSDAPLPADFPTLFDARITPKGVLISLSDFHAVLVLMEKAISGYESNGIK